MLAPIFHTVPRTAGRDAHDHRFGQDQARPGQGRTALVLVLTLLTMVAEIVAGTAFGSIALLADGLHMGSHAAALAVALLAYSLMRRHADDRRFSFGVGKLNALAGFASAMLLVSVALLMMWESLQRWRAPVPIDVDQALVVALIGLGVNGVSALLLGRGAHGHAHGHVHGANESADGHGHGQDPVRVHREQHQHAHDDHNLRAAYLHVLADALTSVLAIGALLAAKVADAVWMDPLMGIAGGVIVLHWSAGLVRETSRVLLDRQAPAAQLEAVRTAIESTPDDRLLDLHIWRVGPGLWAAELVVESRHPASPDAYRARLPAALPLAHVVIEVRQQPA